VEDRENKKEKKKVYQKHNELGHEAVNQTIKKVY
jgi:hypothetical protein